MPAHSIEGPVIAEQGIISSVNDASNDVIYEPVSVAQCKDNVVISGISCRLPQSENMQQFRDNLMSGVDMVTEDEARWTPGINMSFVKILQFAGCICRC